MKYIIGKKKGMTQRFLENGEAVAVTVIEAPESKVTAVKTEDRDGYNAIQLGAFPGKNISKAEKGHLKKLPAYTTLKEFPQMDTALAVGDTLTVRQFVAGDEVDVVGTSKGRGFQGVVKRHKFKGSLATHGHKDQLRMPGSIGATEPARVFKGTRMAGQMGAEKSTIKNCEVIEVLPDENVILVKGAVPGPTNGFVYLFSASTTEPPKEEPKEEVKNEQPKEEVKQDKPVEVKKEEKEVPKEAKQDVPDEKKTEDVKS